MSVPADLYKPIDLKSWVWKHFQLSKTDAGFAWCSVQGCINRKISRPEGSTTNLKMHLQNSHHIYKKPLTKSTSIKDALMKQNASPNLYPAAKQRACHQSIARMLIDNALPFRLVDSPAFIDAMQDISDNKYSPVGRTKITSIIDELYKDMVDTVGMHSTLYFICGHDDEYQFHIVLLICF